MGRTIFVTKHGPLQSALQGGPRGEARENGSAEGGRNTICGNVASELFALCSGLGRGQTLTRLPVRKMLYLTDEKGPRGLAPGDPLASSDGFGPR